TITLRWEDPAFWGEQPPVAGYVHAIAVRRAFAGLGPKMLEWAEEQVRGSGRGLVRLDCRTDTSGCGATTRSTASCTAATRASAISAPASTSGAARRQPALRDDVDESARLRCSCVTDMRASRGYARSGSEGGRQPHPQGGGAGFAAPKRGVSA